MTIKDNIKHLREQRDMTQQELADVLGVNRATIAQWETGTSYPRMGTAMEMCEYFAISLNDLVDDSPVHMAVNRNDTGYTVELKPSTETDELMRLYRSMTDEGKRQLMDYARYVAGQHPKNQAMGIA